MRFQNKGEGILLSPWRLNRQGSTEAVMFVLDKAWVGVKWVRLRKRNSDKGSSRNNGMDIKETLVPDRKREVGLFDCCLEYLKENSDK